MTKFRLIFAIFLALFVMLEVYAADISVNVDCRLADAIKAANTDSTVGGCPAGDGVDVIILSNDITLQKALPLVTSEITVEGAGHTIAGKNRFHIFGVNTRGNLTIKDATITRGKAAWGGALGNLGGELTIINSIITRNSADEGGAIGNGGIVRIQNSEISHNLAADEGGGIYNDEGRVIITDSIFVSNRSDDDGGAIFDLRGTVIVTNGDFHANLVVGDGGAIYSTGGKVTITDSVLRNNRATDGCCSSGGAIYQSQNLHSDNSDLHITGSTFIKNSSINGGAIHAFAKVFVVTNSTFTGNTARENGGAIQNDDEMTIHYSTFVGNRANKDGGALYVNPDSWGKSRVYSSLITGSIRGGDCFGRLDTNSSNLIEDGSCYADYSDDPMLSNLTWAEDDLPPYYSLLPGSPAIDAAYGSCPRTDQIGTPRPQGEACDIGAIEFVGTSD